MQRIIFLLAALSAGSALAQSSAGPFEGRWDLTIKTPKETYPSWLEVTNVGGKAAVRLVSQVSSVHPPKEFKLDGSHLSFSSSEWFGKPIPVDWEFTAQNGKLTGRQKRSDGVQGVITGVPAPKLDRPAPKAWSKPEPLFNGKDLSGWLPDEPDKNYWKAINGELVNEKGGANLRTTRKFQDFKLHVEYNCPNLGNSGVYLRGRYEIQVEYEKPGTNDKFHGMGSLYGFIAPSAAVPPKPGEWQTYDITLVGRRVTLVHNGVTTIDNQEIPGITGGALDSREAEPGPIYFQGDHTGGLKYRNITISVPQN